jgi:hypothetical protein
VPVLFVSVVVAWLHHRPARGVVLRTGASAIAGLGATFLAYLLFERAAGGTALYGGQVHALNSGRFNFRQFITSIYQFYFGRLTSLQPPLGPPYGYRQVFIDTFYGTFGNLEVSFRPRVYDLLQLLSAVGLVSLYTACIAGWRKLWRNWPAVTLMVALVVTLLLFLHYVSYRALLGDHGSDPLIVGRYLLPMVSLFGLAIAFTVGSLPRRAGVLVGAVILSIGALLALGGIGITAARFYV